jgi:hypothetical protein
MDSSAELHVDVRVADVLVLIGHLDHGVAREAPVGVDREYTIDSFGSFTGHSMIKMANEDKHICNSHIHMKLRRGVHGKSTHRFE